MTEGWELEYDVICVSCPDCAFTYDAIHKLDATDEYSCPLCAEARLERELAGVRWRGRLVWYPYTEVTVIAEHSAFLWALDDCGEPYTLRADCVERINP